MITAQVAWELQEATDGSSGSALGNAGEDTRRPALRRTRSSHPAATADYVRAVKACFAGFTGEPLDHHGPYYELTFLNRQWSPGPIDVGAPPVDVAAVNPWMLKMAGEVADGVHVHPIGEPGYLRRTVLPNVAAGAAAAGRDPAEVSLIVPSCASSATPTRNSRVTVRR
jgi:alkanesulfonate monooxygenase SsuD/methylene tetrahydromethanopterin reductase-like flavin-dependent oxidoreductase (luciferase family)